MWSEVKEKTLSDIEDDPVDPSNLLVNVFSFGSTEGNSHSLLVLFF